MRLVLVIYWLSATTPDGYSSLADFIDGDVCRAVAEETAKQGSVMIDLLDGRRYEVSRIECIDAPRQCHIEEMCS